MGKVASPKKPTLESLAAQMRRLQERIEDMEDLMELFAGAGRKRIGGTRPPRRVACLSAAKPPKLRQGDYSSSSEKPIHHERTASLIYNCSVRAFVSDAGALTGF
jgi:hypothetical protein